jgi:hypothetical protein
MDRTNPQTNGQTTNNKENSELQVLSALMSRLSLGGQLGYSHKGDRNLYETLGYPNKVTSPDLISRWKRQDIARAIVDRPVKATWRGDVGITEPEQEEETTLEKEYSRLDKRLGLKQIFSRVDRLSQLGDYAVILLGYDDSSAQTWSQPVTEGTRSLKYVKVVSEKNADISTWEKDTTNERYGLPRLYNIKLRHPGEEEKTTSIVVHHSRIVHVTSELLEDEVEGEPVLKTAINRLVDLEKLVGGSAEMFWRGARPGYAGIANPDYKVDQDLEDRMKEQLKEYEHDLRRFMMLEGVDIKSLAQQIADPSSHVDVQIKMISALTGIPARILLGSEQGSLASSQDASHWKEWVHDRRTESAEPTIIRPFISSLMNAGVLPEPLDLDVGYEVTWPDLFTLGEKDKADVGSKRANAISSYAREPMAETMVPLEGFLRYVLRMDDNEVKHILEMQENQIDELMKEENELEEDLMESESSSSAASEDDAE